MYLRWMVRSPKNKVDFGIWKKLNSNQLSCPLDIHTGNIARKLGLLNRKINDIKALKELDKILRSFDPSDPVKYDFALFGLGVYNFWVGNWSFVRIFTSTQGEKKCSQNITANRDSK